MDVQREVQKNLTERVVVDEAIPMSIVIGPFHLITEPIRSNLSKKRKAMAHAIMDLYASELKVKTEEVSHKKWFLFLPNHRASSLISRVRVCTCTRECLKVRDCASDAQEYTRVQ